MAKLTSSSTLERIRSANFRWIRQFAYWDEIEARPGGIRLVGHGIAYRRSALREIRRAIEPVAVIMNSPRWTQALREVVRSVYAPHRPTPFT